MYIMDRGVLSTCLLIFFINIILISASVCGIEFYMPDILVPIYFILRFSLRLQITSKLFNLMLSC